MRTKPGDVEVAAEVELAGLGLVQIPEHVGLDGVEAHRARLAEAVAPVLAGQAWISPERIHVRLAVAQEVLPSIAKLFGAANTGDANNSASNIPAIDVFSFRSMHRVVARASAGHGIGRWWNGRHQAVEVIRILRRSGSKSGIRDPGSGIRERDGKCHLSYKSSRSADADPSTTAKRRSMRPRPAMYSPVTLTLRDCLDPNSTFLIHSKFRCFSLTSKASPTLHRNHDYGRPAALRSVRLATPRRRLHRRGRSPSNRLSGKRSPMRSARCRHRPTAFSATGCANPTIG